MAFSCASRSTQILGCQRLAGKGRNETSVFRVFAGMHPGLIELLSIPTCRDSMVGITSLVASLYEISPLRSSQYNGMILGRNDRVWWSVV